MDALEILFWVAVGAIAYAYLGYPLCLAVLGRLRPRPVHMPDPAYAPPVTVLVPVHNEARLIRRKLDNLVALDYPRERLEIVVVSDGSTDESPAIVREYADRGVRLMEVPERRGKANALNTGLEAATGEIVVFTDASIMLRPEALRRIVLPLQDPAVGCVSGEDRIEGGGGEGAYGRYELYLRRKESAIASIVGASGSFYAQRRALCRPFREGMAPDFLSVLETVEAGYRAVSEESAVGTMTSVVDPRDEFRRKVRTLVRGYAALFARPSLLDPRRHGLFAFILFSHKLVRWSVPAFMLLALLANLGLLASPLYQATLAAQAAGYAAAAASLIGVPVLGTLPGARICLYFVNVNAAIAYAWLVYLRGARVEIWNPSQRSG